MAQPRVLVLLLVLLVARRGLSLKLYQAESVYGCINAALSDASRAFLGENSPLEKRSFGLRSGGEEEAEDEEAEEEGKGKRTYPGVTRYKSLSQAQGKGKAPPGPANSDRRTKFTLSLDVPTNIMNILFNIAKAKNMRAKAAANAQLMAQIGRRK
ncbi:urocortin-3 [Anolis carolinensis]|uniref:Corticotropin-releasing factor domain-containing protein n=1 Tax=Anolis carolinensis TaxID=28377 RepID=G1KB15_ANOCA|nr:PREDICTED: urocortin-3 [Anolis carolinensis]|eukprot:XP_003220800.1 PREDICTED: urocortin-3 [Anolis carolinensis]